MRKNTIRQKHNAFENPLKVRTFIEILSPCQLLKMVMIRSSRTITIRLRKRGSINKERAFNQDGSTMDPIDVEPLSSTPPTALVPDGTYEENVTTVYTTR